MRSSVIDGQRQRFSAALLLLRVTAFISLSAGADERRMSAEEAAGDGGGGGGGGWWGLIDTITGKVRPCVGLD